MFDATANMSVSCDSVTYFGILGVQDNYHAICCSEFCVVSFILWVAVSCPKIGSMEMIHVGCRLGPQHKETPLTEVLFELC